MKRVLIVTYYYPPSGGSGVQRVLKFTRYLRTFGWEPVVLTVNPVSYPALDASMMDEVPAGMAVYRTSFFDPLQWYARLTGKPVSTAIKSGSLSNMKGWKDALSLWVRANLFVPDSRIGWVPFAVAKGKQLIEEKGLDMLLTSGPPHSVHLTGWLLQRMTGIPWVADFRDPWTEINYYHELPHLGVVKKLDAFLERLVLRSASRVVTVSPYCRTLLLDKVSERKSDFHIIQNGFDPADFVPKAPPLDADTFWITYTGSLYLPRNPTPVWKVLGSLFNEGKTPRLKVRLVGSVDPQILSQLQKMGFEDRVHHVPYVPHHEAIAYTRQSHVLLLSIEDFKHNESVITGKMYEYLASGRPVLGVGPVQGDAARLLESTKGGVLFDWKDEDGIASWVLQQYAAWEAGTPIAGATKENVAPLSRKTQTGELASLFDELMD